MGETWRTEDGIEVRGAYVEEALRRQTFLGLRSSLGRTLMVVTNGERAMVVLLEHEGDAGQHLVDPSCLGASGNYVLDNGQVDEYPNSDTVDLGTGLEAVRALVEGLSPANVTWLSDR